MNAGFLCLETSASHPGLVRLRKVASAPPPPTAGTDPAVRLVVRFNDLEAARMHAHNALRRRLVDADAGTYRATLEEAVAGIEAIDLSHRRVYLDPQIDAASRAAIEAGVQRRRRRMARADLLWQIAGGLGIGLLALLALGF